MTCNHCRGHPADQVLFTTFVRCGEGDATKRGTKLCEQCCRNAIRILHQIGMTIAFDGDGQLRWEAHVRLLENATTSRTRRAIQRDDMLVRMIDRSAPKRGAEASEPEKLSILCELANVKLIENTVEQRGEFRPDDTCRLTEDGERVATSIQMRRRSETD